MRLCESPAYRLAFEPRLCSNTTHRIAKQHPWQILKSAEKIECIRFPEYGLNRIGHQRNFGRAHNSIAIVDQEENRLPRVRRITNVNHGAPVLWKFWKSGAPVTCIEHD